MADPTEHQIIMQAESVRAIIAGTKTQTRRVVKPQPPEWVGRFGHSAFTPAGHVSGRGTFDGGAAEKFFRSPYGEAGHRLWVRETWAAHFIWNEVSPSQVEHDDGKHCLFYRADGTISGGCDVGQRGRWRSSRYMPRWASRLELDVTEVRVERLQDISEEDAKAEGKDNGRTWKYGLADRDGLPGTDDTGWPWSKWEVDPRRAFSALWDSINAKRGFSWASNPWVWVVSFEVRR